MQKTLKDIDLGRAGPPVELDCVDLHQVLLVDCFGIWEQHGEAEQTKADGGDTGSMT